MNISARRAPAPEYRTILVPFSTSHHADGALATARALAARFDATIHLVSVTLFDYALDGFRLAAARALGTESDDPRIHVEVDADIAGAVHRRAAQLDSCLVCVSTHGRGRVLGSVIGSTARDIVERAGAPVVVAGPFVSSDPDDETATPPLEVDHLVACVDGSDASERGLPIAAAWAHALGMKLTILTVAEPCPPPLRIGAPWRRHHGPNEDADAYICRVGERWALEVPGLDTSVVYDPIGPGPGLKDYLAAHPTGLVVVTSHLRNRYAGLVLGSGAAGIVRQSTAPALVVPVQTTEGR